MSCNGQPLPAMFVSKVRDHALIGNFLKKKHGLLSKYIKKPEAQSWYFPLAAFAELIGKMNALTDASGIRIYLANLTTTGNASFDNEVVGTGSDNKLTVIFVPTKRGSDENEHLNLQAYFVISPLGNLVSLRREEAIKLVQSYSSKLELLEAIGKVERDNDFTETRSMWKKLSDFQNQDAGLLREIYCQQASGVKLYFGAYEKDEEHHSGVKIGWQITVVFILTKIIHVGGVLHETDFDIEDMPDYPSRAAISDLKEEKIVIKKITGFDTLNPCPPANCAPL